MDRDSLPVRLGLTLFVLVHLLVLGPLLLAKRAAAGTDSEAPRPSAEQARAIFDRFRALAGTWSAVSTKGWEGEIEIGVLARGSVVTSTTRFPDAPANTMQTMVHLDGDRLLLTHYCEAGNQPRLVLSSVGDDDRRATFTFLDATNLPSRDHGHMDQAIYRFGEDGGRFSSRWTWYANGAAEWLEEIVYERQPASGEGEP